MNSLIILITFFLHINSKKQYISIPIYHTKPRDDNFYLDSKLNPALAKIKIGSSKQELSIKLSVKYCPLSIAGIETSIKEPKYDKSNSNTFKNEGEEKPTNILYESYKSYLNASDTIIFGEEKIDKIKFNYATELSQNEVNSGILGLIKSTFNTGLIEYNLIIQLKNRNLISSYTYSLIYDNYEEGKLIIGSYPHEYDSNYKEENKISTNFYVDNYEHITINEVSSIKYGDIETINNSTTIKILHLSFYESLCYGTLSYEKIILKDFFQKYLDEKKCNIEIIKEKSDYKSYVCDSSIDIKKFKDLNILIRGKEEIDKIYLNFTHEDLFKKINGKWYFLVYFYPSTDIDMNVFQIGRQFFKKYIAVFDLDKKSISFYKKVPSSFPHFLSWILLIVAVLIIGYLSYYIYTNRINKRKIRANELEDEFEYTPKKDNGNNNEKYTKLLN